MSKLASSSAEIETETASSYFQQIMQLSHSLIELTCLRGALPPVDLRAVCLVRAMVDLLEFFVSENNTGPVLKTDFQNYEEH